MVGRKFRILPGGPSRFSNFRSPVTVMLPHLIMITYQVLTLFLHERKPSVDPYSGLLQVRPAASSFPIMVTQQVMTRFLRCNLQAARHYSPSRRCRLFPEHGYSEPHCKSKNDARRGFLRNVHDL